MADAIESYCGLRCSECTFKSTHGCKGCIATLGNPFHGLCKVAECAKGRNRRFCGECEHIPCDLLREYAFDPEHGDGGKRIEHCNEIKLQLVREARVGVDPVSYCGHHCDYCFYGPWCGGCRSNYNCCSYATIFADQQCPNIKCAAQKHLDGCYDCEELKNCSIGYYSKEKEGEYVAKATAIFVRKHGKDAYAKVLKRSIDSGLNYPKSFDGTGSVDGALALLEQYL